MYIYINWEKKSRDTLTLYTIIHIDVIQFDII